MVCLIAVACWLPPIPLQPVPVPQLYGRSELLEHGWHEPPPAGLDPWSGTGDTVGVEQWRGLVSAWFGANTDDALTVIACESGGNPDAANPRSSARGLFQHLGRFWPERSAAAGFAGADIFDPEANVAVAAWLSGGGTDWSHWVCQP